MKLKKVLGIMAGFDHEILNAITLEKAPFLCFPIIPDKNKVFDGQTVYLYEKSKGGTGCGMVVGEAKIEAHYYFDHFPFQELFHFWASEIRCDGELVAGIDRIGSFRLEGYLPEYTFHFGLFDEEYLSYAKKYGKLPDSYNDYLHDYIHHPEHHEAREKARVAMGDYNVWLQSFPVMDLYRKLNNQVFVIKIKDIAFYVTPKSIKEYTAEIRQKPFTRAPNGIMYTWDGKYVFY